MQSICPDWVGNPARVDDFQLRSIRWKCNVRKVRRRRNIEDEQRLKSVAETVSDSTFSGLGRELNFSANRFAFSFGYWAWRNWNAKCISMDNDRALARSTLLRENNSMHRAVFQKYHGKKPDCFLVSLFCLVKSLTFSRIGWIELNLEQFHKAWYRQIFTEHFRLNFATEFRKNA